LSASVVDKTYFTGISNVLTMIQGSERGEGGVARFIDQQTGSLMPLSSAAGFTKRLADPVNREVNSPWDAIQAKLAGMSDKLPPARNLWGAERKPMEVYGRVYDALSPIAVSQRIESPIDAEIGRLNIGIRRINKNTIFQTGDVNFRDFPQVYDEYVRLAGNELKHPAWGMGAKDFLDAVVSGKHQMSPVYAMYSDGEGGTKADFIRNVISDYRKLAQQEIMSEEGRRKFPEFTKYIDGRAAKRQQEKMPNIPGLGGMTLPRPTLPSMVQ
jgi:hypothetical protein